MNFRNVLYKVTWVLSCLLVLAFIGLTIYQKQLIKQFSQTPPMENENIVDTADGTVSANTTTPRETGQEELKRQRIEQQKKILEDPDVLDSIRMEIETQYDPLFNVLALPDDTLKTFKKILANSAIAYLELNPEILAAVSETEKATLQKRYDYLRDETQLRVEALLGRENYLTYKSYEEMTFSRLVVSGFTESLTPEEAVTTEQKTSLMDIIFDETRKVYADIGYNPANLLDFPSDMDPDTVMEKMEITDRILSNSLENSGDILNEAQIAAYGDYLRKYSENIEMSLVMLHQLHGG